MKIRIATRKSQLALWQAHHIANRLKKIHADIEIELLPMLTQGDKILDIALADIGGKSLFLKELEQAILEDRADIAVHSMKDVPAIMPESLIISTITEREDERDAFISNHCQHFTDLPKGARLGTSSLRRQCQLKALRPDLQCIALRGNVPTRLKKLDSGEFDAIILAAAGLKRLGLEQRITQFLPITDCLPAVGQGALGIECHEDNQTIINLLKPLNHTITQQCLTAERAVTATLGSGCDVPIAAYAEIKNSDLTLQAAVGTIDGSKLIKSAMTGTIAQATQIGKSVAQQLIDQGAQAILDS